MHAIANPRFESCEVIPFPLRDEVPPSFPPAPAGHYGSRSGPHWAAIAAIVALHGAGIAALIMLDVVHVKALQRELTVVTLVPEPITPDPPAPPPPPQAPEVEVKKTVTPIVSPPPIVSAPVSRPMLVAAVSTPAPPQPSAAVPSVSTAPAPPAPPVLPPDASAATLGNSAPRYPIEARRKRHEGTVRLRVVITPDGRVKEISIARSSGFDSLDDAALAAVRKWKFRPGTQAGTPVEAVGYLNIPFKLNA